MGRSPLLPLGINGDPSLSTDVIRGCLPEACGAGRRKKTAISP